MFNHILDRWPDEYQGYLIRTDFRIGIQITQCMDDKTLTWPEKIHTALELLYGAGIPDVETAIEGLVWFMGSGKPPKKKSKLQEIEEEVKGPESQPDQPDKAYDYDVDSSALWSSFRKVYGIDLSIEKMHWWAFTALMDDMGECSFHKLIEIRTKRMDGDMSPKERDYWMNLKSKFSLGETEDVFTDEQLDSYRQFLMLTKEGE